MSFFATGNRPIHSTQGFTTDPSTSAILAELDSSNFALSSTRGDRNYLVNAWIGASTGAFYSIEHVSSTTVNAAAILDNIFVNVAAGSASQFQTKFIVNGVERIRIRCVSSGVTGTFAAHLQVEDLA